jgi:hypothetical protein
VENGAGAIVNGYLVVDIKSKIENLTQLCPLVSHIRTVFCICILYVLRLGCVVYG